MKKVIVVGAGVFGVEVAIELAKANLDVTLMDQEEDILMGSTSKSILRVHKGLHYPRHPDTALQSMRNYSKFVEKFSKSINRNFDNYYCLAKNSSKVSLAELDEFIKKTGIDVETVDDKELDRVGINHSAISKTFKLQEGVIDLKILKQIFVESIGTSGVKFIPKMKVLKISRESSRWAVFCSQGTKSIADFVVFATYGNKVSVQEDNQAARRRYEYHRTLALLVKSSSKPVGVTIIDGDFLTVLPKGFSNSEFLIYAPSLSTLLARIDYSFPRDWEVSQSEILSNQGKILDRIKFWMPGFQLEGVIDSLLGIRAIKPFDKNLDSRESTLDEIHENVFEILSGKIDHCIEIGSTLKNVILGRI
jgi:hypothetical protein